MILKIINHKVPRKKEFTEDEKLRIDCFKKACFICGFKEEFNKPYGIKMKQCGSSVYLEYNVYQDAIDLDFRGKRGLFDNFYKRQIIANVYNKMHEYMGDGKVDDYSMSKDFEKLNNHVNEIMKQF